MASQAIHRQEKEQFVALFKQDRIDRFEDRLCVLEMFLMTEHHVTVQELTQLLEKEGNTLAEAFVGETLELMCHYGFAQRNSFNNGRFRYEHRHLGQHHDHMVCTKCNAIIEFENQAVEQLQVEIAATYGFHMLQHKMELYGICGKCLETRDLLLPLDKTKTGETVVIKAFRGGSKARLRLLSMGLRIGDKIEVINNLNHGQLVIAADFKRLVLGRGLAEKIQVSPLDKSGRTGTGRHNRSE